ncbi:MAG: murein biosynthesis integral membrane protein MurJ [Gammaproteobacteria bacterium]|nr:murein biosynthesis integral membrane protein MurJ [Gammaproteobacteria bacterium]
MMKKQSLLRSTAVVMFLTLISRLLGLAREIVFAVLFGATAGMDAFIVAFKIPNFLRRLFAEGAFSQAFVPILSEYKTKMGEAELKKLIQHTAGTLGIIVFVVSVIGMLTSALWIALFAPGFTHEPHRYHLASDMLRITFPYLFFISLTALSGGVLNTFSRFSVPAFTPVFLNICFIGMAYGFRQHFAEPVEVLAWAVLLAGIVQFGFQLPFLYRLGLLVWPRWGWHDSGVRRILKLMVPALFGASVAQLSLLIDTVFASFLPTGSISWLYASIGN